MREFVVRGLPRGIGRDAWWLSADGRGSAADQPIPVTLAWKSLGLGVVVLVGLADLLLWQVSPGISLGLFAICLAGAMQLFSRGAASVRAMLWAWLGIALAALSLAELVQPLSVFLMGVALAHFLARCMGGTTLSDAIGRVWAFPGGAIRRLIGDSRAAHQELSRFGTLRGVALRVARDWGFALGLGGMFAGLFLMANPVFSGFLASGDGWEIPADAPLRVLFWSAVAVIIWPLLRLSDMAVPVPSALSPRAASGLITARSASRGLVLFNLLFALQTGSDLSYLWGGVALPEGMSYAQYAHRGAYPLLVAALLAGGFALVLRPVLKDQPVLRLLLLLWVAQTIVLTGSSILRLDLYVSVYGLTHLRFAAFIWMGVVAGGLMLVIWQILAGHRAEWVLLRAAGLGLIAVWGAAWVNVDGLIARVNIEKGLEQQLPGSISGRLDLPYLCHLGEGAAPVLAAHSDLAHCASVLSAPRDWREWGYRNWRLRRSLASMSEGAFQ